MHAVLKRARVSEEVGTPAIKTLIERGIIRSKKCKGADDKLFFTLPFLRFWFGFVSPIFKGIRDGDFTEAKERWQSYENEFVQLPFVELSHAVIKKMRGDDFIMEISQYWRNDGLELDIFAKTKAKKRLIGSCKYSNTKVKKSEITRLEKLAKEAGIEYDSLIIVAKKAFSKELKAQKGEHLQLLTLKNFKVLVE